MDCIIKTAAGLEPHLAQELKSLLPHAKLQELKRAVRVDDLDEEGLYLINYLSRLAHHVLWIQAEGEISGEKDLYDLVRTVPWDEHMHIDQTFAIFPTVQSPHFPHTGYAALKVKDALVDQFRDLHGRRPSVDKEEPDILINVHIYNDRATISLNTSGAPLYQRGYKELKGFATVNEVLAAGMVTIAGWEGQLPLLDPMCGTGSIPLEAAMKARNIPAQKFREHFAFESIRSLTRSTFRQIKRKRARQGNSQSINILGADHSSEAISISKKNAMNAKLTADINWKQADFFQSSPPWERGMIIFNPPYDERMELEDAVEFYQRIGDHLKNNFGGWKVWMLSGHQEAAAEIGMKLETKTTLFNGPLECSFAAYEIYQ